MEPSPLHLTRESIARLLALLCCETCGEIGPHRDFRTVEGGTSARCVRCRAEAGQDQGQDFVDVLHGAAPVEVTR